MWSKLLKLQLKELTFNQFVVCIFTQGWFPTKVFSIVAEQSFSDANFPSAVLCKSRSIYVVQTFSSELQSQWSHQEFIHIMVG